MGVNIVQSGLGHYNLVDDRATQTALFKVGGNYNSPTNADPGIGADMNFKFALTAADTAGGMVSYQNNFANDLVITFAYLDVTTVASAACTVSVGETATNGTTLSSNLISGQDVHSATGLFNSGAKTIAWPIGKWVTASVASGASAGIVGVLVVTANFR